MTTLYFLDAAEFTDVSAVAAAQPGVRHSVWYSALAAVGQGRIVQYDKDALKVEPAP